ncbi:hypothetical protein HALLA_12105 [Halostagnicola larsenii XH-48]|uniref:Uncharacterized protein n=1 Tax=Halostagnicola larsenii XH-48 TaxID=797299 RepID=W0JVA0_9EURY|nr:hypothetical protein [Halostagnicola larsenii]AHG00919.1 hypothetical protein HALLA_11805 [Halostagnicola larsenii XH-48]AHG00968.1 hypothetical protein HALLA_12105 [Halostagnicola larsenii XH-48]
MSSSDDLPSVAEVEAQYGATEIPKEPDDGEDKSQAELLIEAADRMDRDIFGQQVLYTSRTHGNRKDRIILLAAHKWALREGEAQSESQAGGSVSYNTVTGETQDSLTQTKWGREYLGYLEDQPNIGIFSTR